MLYKRAWSHINLYGTLELVTGAYGDQADWPIIISSVMRVTTASKRGRNREKRVAWSCRSMSLRPMEKLPPAPVASVVATVAFALPVSEFVVAVTATF